MEKQKTLLSRSVEIQLSQFGWDELDRVANVKQGGTCEALIRQLLVDYLYANPGNRPTAISYQAPKLVSKDDY